MNILIFRGEMYSLEDFNFSKFYLSKIKAHFDLLLRKVVLYHPQSHDLYLIIEKFTYYIKLKLG